VCGFLGIASSEINGDARTLVRAAARAYVSHRGPDGHGCFDDESMSLECYRLALNGGFDAAQPYRAGHAVVGYNGEIYMLDAKALDISAAGGDIKAVARHLERHTSATGLDGMFAIAHWSSQRRELTLLRDRFGIKPLHWAPLADGLAFGSQSNGVRQLCGLRSIAAETIVACLSLRGPLVDQPTFDGVFPLVPGHILRWTQADGATVSMPCAEEIPASAPSLDQLDAALVSAVRATLDADATVGLCLSGGLDSSLIAAIARHLAGPELPTYVLISDSNDADVRVALAVAGHLGLRPRLVDLRDRWPDILHEIIPRLDEPPTTESTVGVAALAAAARRDGVKALISGEGADEVFGGYEEYRTSPFSVDGLLPELVWLKENLNQALHSSVDSFAQRVSRKVLQQQINGGTPGAFDYEARLARLLRRLDNAMMAYGVEGRVPYLLAPVVTEASRWSWQQRIAGLGKTPLRAVARRWLPGEICDRPKRPFASGVRARPEVIAELLHAHRKRLLEFVTPNCVAQCLSAPSSPQAWKLAVVGLYMDTHGLEVGVEP
jgi:asparagine synthase (glutamine-hydrolysing)